MDRLDSATVLVVDDRAAKRYLLVSWLARAGMAVVEADSGAAALDRIEDGDIDLVVLDVKLGDMSGFDVCEQIKAQSAAGRHPRHPRLGARGRRRRPGAGTAARRGRLPRRADRARTS